MFRHHAVLVYVRNGVVVGENYVGSYDNRRYAKSRLTRYYRQNSRWPLWLTTIHYEIRTGVYPEYRCETLYVVQNAAA